MSEHIEEAESAESESLTQDPEPFAVDKGDEDNVILDDAIFLDMMVVDSLSLLNPGDIVVRWGDSKKQQGTFQSVTDEKDGFVAIDVIDLANGNYLAEAGIIRNAPEDKLYRKVNNFNNSTFSNQAREILKSWPLYGKHPQLQKELQSFLESRYFPEQIIYWKKTQQLNRLFVPMQQRFQIGKFAVKIDYEKELAKRFGDMLSQLYEGKHLTYVAFVPREANKHARFYSIGTKPHLETRSRLREEQGGFNPNQGGHIAVISPHGETPKRFLVDAGSYDLGSGMQTSLAIAEMVSDALKKAYPQFEFKPVAGRGAHGAQQSY